MALTLERFPKDLERENPTKFTSLDLKLATNNYANKSESGSYGSVYNGTFSHGIVVAVKVLHGDIGISNKRMEERFMTEVGKIGKVHPFNLVRLLGFRLEKDTTALIYEYMSNSSIDM
ncbi:hypothetical protein QN277_007255 [Acacia crassicarpa]|uniref:Protein kinase domain-containing protein n=1 Tax=Acacia crassicarpa TaxID=499986 RepID=A0AAE1IWL9_9FABA|nr:hypothetical protein QN277_007255 [Acacia crassicarpa]